MPVTYRRLTTPTTVYRNLPFSNVKPTETSVSTRTTYAEPTPPHILLKSLTAFAILSTQGKIGYISNISFTKEACLVDECSRRTNESSKYVQKWL